MAESLKDIINKLKAQQNQQTSQTSKPEPVKVPSRMVAPEPPRVDEDEFLTDDDDEIMEEEQKKTESKPEDKISNEERQILMEIELLQNDGRFRAEILHQLQEINKALVVIAGALVDLNGKR